MDEISLNDYIKEATRGRYRLIDLVNKSGISRSTLIDWYENGKSDRINLLIDGLKLEEIERIVSQYR